MKIRYLKYILTLSVLFGTVYINNCFGLPIFFDTTYKTKFTKQLNIGIAFTNKNMHFTLKNNNTLYEITPTATNQISLDVDYRFISASISVTPSFLNNSNFLKGQTERKSFNVNATLKQFAVGFQYQRINGFYLKNTADFINNWSADKGYIILNDLEMNQISVSVMYNVNKNYSLRSFASGAEKQLKSCFSFLPTFSFNNLQFKDNLSRVGSHTGNNNYFVNINLPVAYNYVFKKNNNYYMNIMGGPTVGINYYSFSYFDGNTVQKTDVNSKMAIGYVAKWAFGYCGTKNYWGVDIQQAIFSNTNSNYTLAVTNNGIHVYFGVRLKSPTVLKKSADWLNKTSPVKLE